jgi:hypothetical protein
MSAPADIPELPEDDAVLREIAAMDLALARRPYGEAMAEADAEKAADITRAYNRVTRSLRQSIALRARLAQGWENHHVNHGRRVDLTAESPTLSYLGLAASGLAQPGRPDPAAARAEADRRRAILQRAVQRIIWNERETERLDRPAAARLRDRLADEALAAVAEPALARAPVERLVRDVCRRYGLRYNPDWESLPKPLESWLFPQMELADDG